MNLLGKKQKNAPWKKRRFFTAYFKFGGSGVYRIINLSY